MLILIVGLLTELLLLTFKDKKYLEGKLDVRSFSAQWVTTASSMDINVLTNMLVITFRVAKSNEINLIWGHQISFFN